MLGVVINLLFHNRIHAHKSWSNYSNHKLKKNAYLQCYYDGALCNESVVMISTEWMKSAWLMNVRDRKYERKKLKAKGTEKSQQTTILIGEARKEQQFWIARSKRPRRR